MNKNFLLFMLLSSTILLQANQRRATCDNAQPPLTEEEHATCTRVEEFMIEATKLHSEGQGGWQARQRLGLTQWNLALKEIPLSATSAKHIEAVLCDAGFGTMWNASHSWEKSLKSVMWNEVCPAIASYGKSAVMTVTGVAAGASIFMHKATVEIVTNGVKQTLTIPASRRTTTYPGLPPITDSVHEESLTGATLSALNDWTPSTQHILFTLTIGAAYIGGQVYYKIHEELPFMYFKSLYDVQEYLETLDGIA